jgi:hypothetical protein
MTKESYTIYTNKEMLLLLRDNPNMVLEDYEGYRYKLDTDRKTVLFVDRLDNSYTEPLKKAVNTNTIYGHTTYTKV